MLVPSEPLAIILLTVTLVVARLLLLIVVLTVELPIANIDKFTVAEELVLLIKIPTLETSVLTVVLPIERLPTLIVIESAAKDPAPDAQYAPPVEFVVSICPIVPSTPFATILLITILALNVITLLNVNCADVLIDDTGGAQKRPPVLLAVNT